MLNCLNRCFLLHRNLYRLAYTAYLDRCTSYEIAPQDKPYHYFGRKASSCRLTVNIVLNP